MNIKITTDQHERLLELSGSSKFLFGSHLHGTPNENSDIDYVMVYNDRDLFPDEYEPYNHLPNIHSFQYDDKKYNTQYIWMSRRQFWRNLWSGDGNMIADIVLLSDIFKKPLFLCRTTKVIKGYLGVVKRDLKLHGDYEKKRFHAYRSIMMARMLLENKLPTVSDIKNLKKSPLPTKEDLSKMERELRENLNNNKEITMYPEWKTGDSLLDLQIQSNNTKEFKYD